MSDVTHPEPGEVYCPRCGGEMEWLRCENCGGEGLDGHECGEDCCACAEPEENVECGWCDGRGGSFVCGNKREWCESRPIGTAEPRP